MSMPTVDVIETVHRYFYIIMYPCFSHTSCWFEHKIIFTKLEAGTMTPSHPKLDFLGLAPFFDARKEFEKLQFFFSKDWKL